jgi:hypothetical protein
MSIRFHFLKHHSREPTFIPINFNSGQFQINHRFITIFRSLFWCYKHYLLLFQCLLTITAVSDKNIYTYAFLSILLSHEILYFYHKSQAKTIHV